MDAFTNAVELQASELELDFEPNGSLNDQSDAVGDRTSDKFKTRRLLMLHLFLRLH